MKKSRDQIQHLQTEVNTFNEKLQHAREQRNILFGEQLKIQSDMQRLKELRDKQTELHSRRVTLIESVQKLQDKFLTEDSKLETAVRQLDLLKVCIYKTTYTFIYNCLRNCIISLYLIFT